jgi:hypothetical protein
MVVRMNRGQRPPTIHADSVLIVSQIVAAVETLSGEEEIFHRRYHSL